VRTSVNLSLILSAPRVRGVRIANALSHTRRADRGVARRHAAAAVDRHTARRASRKREVSSERGAPAARETRWRTRDWGDPGRGVGRRGRPPRRRRPSSASTRRTRSGSRRARSRRVMNARCPRARARRRRAMPPDAAGDLSRKRRINEIRPVRLFLQTKCRYTWCGFFRRRRALALALALMTITISSLQTAAAQGQGGGGGSSGGGGGETCGRNERVSCDGASCSCVACPDRSSNKRGDATSGGAETSCECDEGASRRHTGFNTTPFARCTPFLEDLARPAFTSARPRFRSRRASTPRDSD